MPVLGYDVDPRGGRLIVNETEAARVRDIFELYLKERALLPTVKELARRGWTTKRWTTKKGHERGGSAFNKTNLYRFLTNAVYIGKVDYQGEIYEGEHDAIISEDVFGCVRTLLRENRRNGGSEVRNRYGALLKGLLYCGSCKTSMIHAYTSQRGKRYRYYVCSHAQKNGWDTCPVKSLPASEIERFVIETIRNIGKDDALAAEVIRKARIRTFRPPSRWSKSADFWKRNCAISTPRCGVWSSRWTNSPGRERQTGWPSCRTEFRKRSSGPHRFAKSY